MQQLTETSAGDGLLHPVDDFESWCGAMRQGVWEQAWRINDRLGQHWPSAHQFWSGECLRGKRVTVWSLHGLGDAVQMLQYASTLRDMGVEARFLVPSALLPLMPYFAGVEQFGTFGESFTAPKIEMMELPFMLRSQPCELPLATSYLRLPEGVVRRAGRHLGDPAGMQIGLVWAGGTWDASRWIPRSCFDKLAGLPDVTFWNLQSGPQSAAPGKLTMRVAAETCGSELLAFAATVANMDLVITVDTLAAHIAGALGIPTLLLLKHEADWRWMMGPRTPWYPTLRLIRQSSAGDWGPVIAEVSEEITRNGSRTLEAQLQEIE